MKQSIQLTVQVTNGKLTPSEVQLAEIREFLKRQPTVTIKISRPVKVRSQSQNRMYWAILGNISGHTGHSSEELHEYFKDAFMPRSYLRLGGVEHEVPKSTTTLTTQEFNQYLEMISAFAANNLGMLILPGRTG